ncbi:MAG: magnesium/cobalt transporter CorA [Chloroflexi bacterium]|nr:magnesium/cobalt transporter CorA [Chloroflexota bacterium]
MIRAVFFAPQSPIQFIQSPADIQACLADQDGLLWVSMEDAQPADFQAIMQDIFHFHPLTIEDCQSVGYQPPKVDEFKEYLFTIFHALSTTYPDGDLETRELDCILGPNYLVTSYQGLQMAPVASIWERIKRDQRLVQNGADFLFHAVIDQLVDDYMPFLDQFDNEIDALEDQVIEKPQQPTLERILALKHNIVTLRRILSPQREILNRLSRDDLQLIKTSNRIYFRDIYDHVVRIQDLSESIRDIVSGTLDTYLSVTSNRLNEVMKALTIVSTIFLPLSFVAGVFGMNFKHMPELNWPWGYPLAWVLFIAITIGMVLFFKRRGWL